METSPITLCSACVQMIVLLFANTEDRKMGQQKKKKVRTIIIDHLIPIILGLALFHLKLELKGHYREKEVIVPIVKIKQISRSSIPSVKCLPFKPCDESAKIPALWAAF